MFKDLQGVHGNHFIVIPRVLIILFNKNSTEVLLQKRSPEKIIWPDFFNGLGGHVEKNEDVLSAANRELYEESGLDQIKLSMFGSVTIDVEKETGVLMFLFKGTCSTRKMKRNPEGLLKWFKIEEIKKINYIPDLPLFIDLCLEWKPGDPIYHLHSFYKDGNLVVEGANTRS